MNETQPNEQDFAALVALDWADQKHAGAWCLPAGKVNYFELQQSAEAIDCWAAEMRQRTGGRLVAVALEQSKGALIYALMKYEFLVLYPVNPKQLARFREALTPSGAKNDPNDAGLLLDLLRVHRDRLRAWRPDDATTRLIGVLAEDRRALVNRRTRLINALKSRLKQYFPLALDVLGDLDTELACQFLLRWSTLAELQQEDPHKIDAHYRDLHCRRPELIAERLEKIAQAQPLVTDAAILESGRMMVRSLASQLLALIEPLKQ